jgi:pimeloyl-ACP methyl ester carboxylesterase
MASKSSKPRTAKASKPKPPKAKASKSNVRKYLIRIGIIIVTLYVAICTGMYFQDRIVFRPTVVDQSTQWDLKLADGKPAQELSAEEITLEAELDGSLNAMHFKCHGESKGVVLFLHGNGGNLQGYLKRRSDFLRRHYDFFIVDYRGYGKSTGPISEAGVDADAEAAYDYLAKQYPPEKIVVYGQSLGSGFAVRLAKRHQPHRLFLEVPYTSLADVGAYQYPWLPVRLLTKYPGPSLALIDDLRCPVRVIHGTADEVIPYEMGQALAAKAKDGRLYTCPDVGHNGCSQTTQYVKMLDENL